MKVGKEYLVDKRLTLVTDFMGMPTLERTPSVQWQGAAGRIVVVVSASTTKPHGMSEPSQCRLLGL